MSTRAISLAERFGAEAAERIVAMHEAKRIVAIHHWQAQGTCLILADGQRILLEGTSEDDARRLVGYLGFRGCGEHGLDTPAFAPHVSPLSQPA